MTDLNRIKSIQNDAERWATEYHYNVLVYPQNRDDIRYYSWTYNGMVVSIVINTSKDGNHIHYTDMPLPYIHMLPSDRKL